MEKAFWDPRNAQILRNGRAGALHYFTNENSVPAIGIEVRPYFSHPCSMET